MCFLFKEFCNFWSPAELDLFPWSQVRQSMQNKEFQGPAGIFKSIDRRAGLRCFTERSTTQQKTQQGRIAVFLLRCVHPPCEEHSDTNSPLHIAARASQCKKVYLGTVKVCTELWRQFQALFLFHPCQLVAASCCCQLVAALQLPLLLSLPVPAYANTLLSIQIC